MTASRNQASILVPMQPRTVGLVQTVRELVQYQYGPAAGRRQTKQYQYSTVLAQNQAVPAVLGENEQYSTVKYSRPPVLQYYYFSDHAA